MPKGSCFSTGGGRLVVPKKKPNYNLREFADIKKTRTL